MFCKSGSNADANVTLEDFDLKNIIGKGSYGKVYLVEKRDTGHKFAMKSIRKDMVINNDQYENTKLEKEILLQIDHPFLVSM